MTKIPIGISDFHKLRSEGYNYIDKTSLIVDVLNHPAEVLLLPRPRRFGKTLNLSMLAYFLDMRKDSRALFEGLAVENHPEIMAKQGQYPTIFLTFKDIKSLNWDECFKSLRSLLSDLFISFKPLLVQTKLEASERARVTAILKDKADLTYCQGSLKLLTALLQRATGQKVVLLIDEYDTPIHAGYQNGYFPEVVSFMRALLGGGLKDNRALEKGVLTGILRVARESIFSGLNNLLVYNLLDEPFSSHFGFTQPEVDRLLGESGCNLEGVREWYNGYRFGPHVIYNPWSILNVALHPKQSFQAHWVNTSGNDLIRALITGGGEISGETLQRLLAGERIRREVDDSIVLNSMEPKMVWGLLLFSGYLTSADTERSEGRILCHLCLPNREVRSFFDNTIRNWLGQQTSGKGLDPFFRALYEEDLNTMELFLTDLLCQVLSYHELGGSEPERVYHAFMLGLLADWRDRYEIKSNREAGWGRYDLALLPKAADGKGYLFEFKRGEDLGKAAEMALAQIEKRAYFAAFEERGVESALLIGVGLQGKSCKIASRAWKNPVEKT